RWAPARRPESIFPVRVERTMTVLCVADVRVIGAIVELAAGLIALRPNESLTVSADGLAKAGSLLRIAGRASRSGSTHPPPNAAPLGVPRYAGSEDVVCALAERVGLAVTVSPDRRSVVIRLPRAA